MFHINSEAYHPEDAALLLQATRDVLRTIEAHDAVQANPAKAAQMVLAIARAGYGRSGDHCLDADDLVEAAITRYRAVG